MTKESGALLSLPLEASWSLVSGAGGNMGHLMHPGLGEAPFASHAPIPSARFPSSWKWSCLCWAWGCCPMDGHRDTTKTNWKWSCLCWAWGCCPMDGQRDATKTKGPAQKSVSLFKEKKIGPGLWLSHEKEWNNAICGNMYGSRDCQTEWRKSDREGEISYNIPYRWNLKRNDINELTYQTETDSQI